MKDDYAVFVDFEKCVRYSPHFSGVWGEEVLQQKGEGTWTFSPSIMSQINLRSHPVDAVTIITTTTNIIIEPSIIFSINMILGCVDETPWTKATIDKSSD